MNNSTNSNICYINDKSSKKEFGEGQCTIGNIAAILFKYDFGYICMGILGIIIFISIFGGIKQNYRWFILNQAIWDLIKSYEFCCNNFLSNYVKPSATASCFFYNNKGAGPWDNTAQNIIFDNIYNPLLLLSVTRFIALYFVNFYDKLTQGYRVFITIILFNIFFMFFQTEYLISIWLIVPRNTWLVNECKIKEQQILNSSSTLCTVANTKDFISYFFSFLWTLCNKIHQLNPAICLFISFFSTLMIIFKVAKQAKFQLKHNRRDFFNSVRVAAVILSQTLMTFFIFVLQFFDNIQPFISTFSSVPVLTNEVYDLYKDRFNFTGYLDFRLPLWIDGILGLTGYGGQQIVTQSRIFIESLIVLAIMTGYREAIVKFFNNMFLLFRNPRQFLKSLKKTAPRNSWT